MTTPRRPRGAFFWLFWAIPSVIGSLFAIIFIIFKSLQPAPGEWATPVQAGPLTLQLSVPALIRLATAPWVAPLLDGRRVPSRLGSLHLTWQRDTGTLALRCAPCRLPAPGLGGEPLHLDEVRLAVRRQGDALAGEATAGQVRATWQGTLAPEGLALQIALAPTPIREGY